MLPLHVSRARALTGTPAQGYPRQRAGRKADDLAARVASQKFLRLWPAGRVAALSIPAAGSTALPKSRGARSLLNRARGCLARGRFLQAVVPTLLAMYWTWWWLVEFVFLDIVATVAVLSGYLTLVIRKAVL
jgi:hypothetical protein